MFADSFPINALIFLLGQLAAWGYLRTGLVLRGVCIVVVTWLATDVALVARFGFADGEFASLVALIAMQSAALGGLVLYLFGRIRRRRNATKDAVGQAFLSARIHYLKNELDPAVEQLRTVVRRDPWHLAGSLALGTAYSRSGQPRRALRWLRRARSLDLSKANQDAIAQELDRL